MTNRSASRTEGSLKKKSLSPVERMSRYLEIRCRSTGRLLVRINEQGPELFCRMHNSAHQMTWEQWERLKEEIDQGSESTYWLDV